MDTQGRESLNLTPSNVRTGLLFAAMVVWFVLGASRYAATGGILPLALSMVGLFGTVVYGLMLIPGSSYLEATPDGLTVSTAFRKRSYVWSQIDSFHAERIWTRQVVKCRLNAGEGERRAREETLPDTYGLSAEELAGRLNAFRRRYR
jgi:hypothetical protein